MAATSTVEGVFRAAGRPIDGATAYLIPSAAFLAPPQVGDPIPTSSAIATCVTGPANGSNGAYRFIAVAQQEYYAGVAFAGTTGWDYHNASNVGVGASGQLTLNSSSAFHAIPFEVLVDGVHRFHTGLGPSGGTIYASGALGLHGPWDPFTPTTLVPPPSLRIAQSPTNTNTPASGAMTWIDINGRWGIGHLDTTNIIDTVPDFVPAGYPGGGNSLAFIDLLLNERRANIDSAGELHIDTRNPSASGVLNSFTQSRLYSGSYSDLKVGWGVGHRTLLYDNTGAGQPGSYWNTTTADVSHTNFTTQIDIYSTSGAVLRTALTLTRYGGLLCPGNPQDGGILYPLLGLGNAGFGASPGQWGGSAGGTFVGLSARPAFQGSFIDAQVSGSTVFQVNNDGQTVISQWNNTPAGVTYPLRLQHKLIGGTPQVGMGVGIQFFGENDARNLLEVSTLQVVMENITAGNEASHITISTMAGGVERTALTLGANGDLTGANDLYLINDPLVSANHGVVNIGTGGFSGSAPNFVGSAFGTQLAINAAAGFGGDLVNAGCSGSTKFRVDRQGKATIAGDLAHQGTNLGFYATTPISKPTVSGTKSGGTALSSLITQLVALGLITDTTT